MSKDWTNQRGGLIQKSVIPTALNVDIAKGYRSVYPVLRKVRITGPLWTFSSKWLWLHKLNLYFKNGPQLKCLDKALHCGFYWYDSFRWRHLSDMK